MPFVVTEHVTWFERNMLSEKELAAVSRDYNAADAVIAVGEGLKNAIQPLYRKAVQVIPNLADRRFFAERTVPLYFRLSARPQKGSGCAA